MSNAMRWRHGDTNPITVAVDSATVIEIGDLVWLDTDDAKPAAVVAWDTDLATTQPGLHDTFLGVAMQASASGDAGDIRIATSGVFEFDTASATYQPGALVGPAKATGDNLENQKVAATVSVDLSIGRVAQLATSATKVLVRIASTNQTGGPQEAA